MIMIIVCFGLGFELELGAVGLQVQRSNRSATLPRPYIYHTINV